MFEKTKPASAAAPNAPRGSKSLDKIKEPFGNGPGEILPLDWVTAVIEHAIELKASDIHVDVGLTNFMTRYRMDGTLVKIDERSNERYDMVVSCLKVMGLLNTAERRQPQEGHAVIQIPPNSDTFVDLRVSVFPTIFGEAIAIRILNRREFLFESFEEMGMRPDDANMFRDAITKPHGMILVTGPAGSGKSATLYTALNHIRSEEKNIVTLEDPIEYQMDLVRQSQINSDIDYSFARGMRSILRQDPDVIMIGEIRDDETAEIAARAALTGRLVFSTLHTNDTVGAVVRFLEFGIPRSFIATALLLVVARRLVRLNCQICREAYSPSEKTLREAGLSPEQAAQFTFYRGKGCPACRDTGFSGRTGIFEFFHVDRDMELAILEGTASYSALWEAARGKGMRTLHEGGLQIAVEGKTSLEEALHVTA